MNDKDKQEIWEFAADEVGARHSIPGQKLSPKYKFGENWVINPPFTLENLFGLVVPKLKQKLPTLYYVEQLLTDWTLGVTYSDKEPVEALGQAILKAIKEQ